MHTVLVVFLKEMTDNLRDRRSIAMAMLYPMIGPILLGLMIGFVGASLKAAPRAGVVVPAIGIENAPALRAFLETKNVVLRRAPADAVDEVRAGNMPLVLVLPQRAGNSEAPLEIDLLTDASRIANVIPIAQVMDLLHSYQEELTAARLKQLGVDPKILTPVDVEQRNVGRAISLGATFLNMMPPFFIFTLFLGGVYLTLDTTSGERERGSFEPLMINPVSRSEVLTGKFCAAVVFTLTGLGVQMLAFWSMLHLVPRQALGLADPPDAARLALLIPVCVPIALFAVSAQLVIAAVTRSLKEAQTYLGLLPLVPAIAGMLLVFTPVELHAVLAAIPTFGQTVLMGQVIRHDTLSWTMVSVSAFATLACTGLLLALAFRLYEREQILFPH